MKIIKVEFKKNGIPEYYQVKDIAVKHGDHVIVEADKGVQFATAISNIFEMDDEKFSVSLKSVIRIATKKISNNIIRILTMRNMLWKKQENLLLKKN